MFIIEKFRNDFESRQKAYETACKKWIEAGEDTNGYNYRSERDYRNKFGGSPGERVRFIFKNTLVFLLVGGIIFLFFGFVKEISIEPENKPAEVAVEYKNGDECHSLKVGDTGIIQWGDYTGAEVRVIGGCGDNESYKVEVIKDQILYAEGMPESGYTDKPIKAGLQFEVDSKDNIFLTGHEQPTEKKE